MADMGPPLSPSFSRSPTASRSGSGRAGLMSAVHGLGDCALARFIGSGTRAMSFCQATMPVIARESHLLRRRRRPTAFSLPQTRTSFSPACVGRLLWFGVVWCGVAWCGVAWCGVVCVCVCVCVVCVLCVCVVCVCLPCCVVLIPFSFPCRWCARQPTTRPLSKRCDQRTTPMPTPGPRRRYARRDMLHGLL